MLSFFLYFLEKKVVKMFGSLDFFDYFCGVKENCHVNELNIFFLKIFALTIVYMNFLYYLCTEQIKKNDYGKI